MPSHHVWEETAVALFIEVPYLVRGHVGASAGAVDREEAEARDVEAVEVAVRVGHQLAAFLRGGVGGNGEVHHILFAEHLSVKFAALFQQQWGAIEFRLITTNRCLCRKSGGEDAGTVAYC